MTLKPYSFKSIPPVRFDASEIKILYFISDNIVVFYPNINIQKVYQIAFDYLIDYYNSFRGEFDCMFRKALFITNKNLLYQFDRKIYQQFRGLVIEVASSPDLVNLYGYFVKDRMDMYFYPNASFYERYINNCLSLVYTKYE